MAKGKKVVRCSACSRAAWLAGCGFTASRTLVCGDRGHTGVDAGDGCTFGDPGEPGRAVFGWDVSLGEHAAVNGAW